jgi:lipoyl synthase
LETKPDWIKKNINPSNENLKDVNNILRAHSLNTVCQSANCPNIFECFSKKTATFMILGNTCTRDCTFCAVTSGKAGDPDAKEPENIATAVSEMGLEYIVITSVTRDDLPDGGAGHFAEVIRKIRKVSPKSKIEVLIPDLKGKEEDLRTILEEDIFVLNHNIETIKRNYPTIRGMADYERSLGILKRSKEIRPDIYIKSGFMVGLSETKVEIKGLLRDLKDHCCDIVTIGQYLRPSKSNTHVQKYYTPEEFLEIKRMAQSFNFKSVACGVFVRSSYMAADLLKE